MVKLQVAVFVLASAGLICVSQASLRQPRAHGFWRFWAWEAIAALVLLAEGARRFGFVTRWPGISSSRGCSYASRSSRWRSACGNCGGRAARAEERENIRFFGPAYTAYMQRTRMFVPFLF